MKIIWCYRGAGYPKKDFGKRHDTIFRYSKTEDYIFNLDDVREEYAEATKERFSHYIGNIRKGKDFGLQKLNPLGRQPDDWWQIQPIAPSAKERLGYPTQKPLELLEKIIKASSNKDDVVLDTFCGCGTTLVAAQKLGRKWIGIDISPTACRVMAQRLFDTFKLKEGEDFIVSDLPKTEEELMRLPHFEFQNWAVIALGGIPNRVKVGDYGIDGKLYPIKQERGKEEGKSLFGDIDIYYPIQVKQKDKVGRPDIDSFETAMRRDKRKRGYFVSFGFTDDAIKEIKRLDKEGELEIIPITVKDLLQKEILEK